MENDHQERPETVTKFRRVIVSYDVHKARGQAAVRVAEYVHGRKVRIRTRRGVKTYCYDGLIMRPDVERLGQSVPIMNEADAEDFHSFLSKMKVSHSCLTIWADF